MQLMFINLNLTDLAGYMLGACRGINPKALNSFTFNILFLLYIL